MITRRAILVGLMACCLAALLFTAIPTIGQTGGYDPWLDVNDDGYIGIDDIFTVASHFGAEGQNIMKAGMLYDSGWIDIMDKCGQNIVVTHNLNSTDLILDIQGKTSLGTGPHQRHYGLTGYASGWRQTYGGAGNDQAWSLVNTSDEGYATAGLTYSYGAGWADFWLVKTDACGHMQWNKTYGGIDQDWAQALVQTGDGGYALAGSTNSFGAGWYDFWLVKTDVNGNAQWNKTYGGAGNDQAWALVQTNDEGYAIAGYTTSFGVGGNDFWLVKTDSTGNVQWNKTYGGTNGDDAYALVQTIDGGYAMAGPTESFGAGSGDFWLVKTDADGSMQWNKTYGGTDLDVALDMVNTSDGGYALAGTTRSYGAGNWDAWLVKTDADGSMQWNKTFGGISTDGATALVQAYDGGYALACRTYSFGAGSGDFWLVRTDADGTMQWSETYGGTSCDEAWALVKTSDGGYAMAGLTQSLGAGDNDFWLIKTDAELGLAWVDSAADTITLYRGATDPYWNYVRVRLWTPK